MGYSTPDKPGKDNNFRGLTIFNNTMYVTKGSGGNGVNTVYQVGKAGSLPSGTTAVLEGLPITILPGFPTSLANGVDQKGNPAPIMYPFGIRFANDHTLYVADEGDGCTTHKACSDITNGMISTVYAHAANQKTAGLQKWIFNGTQWNLAYTLQANLSLGIGYSIANYPTSLNPATDGLRNITGRHNHDGTVTIYAVTSTVSANGDQGADPNKLVKVTDVLDATTPPTGDGDNDRDDSWEKFVTIRSACAGEVLRGVTFAPEDRDFDDDYRDHDDDRR